MPLLPPSPDTSLLSSTMHMNFLDASSTICAWPGAHCERNSQQCNVRRLSQTVPKQRL